jgi:hypothetical protein
MYFRFFANSISLNLFGVLAAAVLVLAPHSTEALTLTNSGPISSSRNGQVIENVRVTSTSGHGIRVTHDDVTIRNVEILHKGGNGIQLSGADRAHIENVNIIYSGAPARGKNSGEFNNIECNGSADITVKRVRMRDGSSGFYARGNCPRAHLSFIEGYNFRGPFPRGQIVQFGDNSNDSVLEDFYNKNDLDVAWTEDNVNTWHSSNITVRRGLIDGNNSPSGIGVIFEHDNGRWTGGLVEDVDAIRMGNGCFSAADANNVTFRNVRCRQNICGNLNGRGNSLSNSLMFHSYQNVLADNIRYEGAKYWDSCNANISWDQSAMAVKDFQKVNYTQREPVLLTFAWEDGGSSDDNSNTDTSGGTQGGDTTNPTVGACSLYSRGNTISAGFGVPWNPISSGSNLLLKSTCNSSGSVTYSVGVGNNLHYIYKTGYYYTNAWQPYTLSGTFVQGSTDWIVGSASYTNPTPPNADYFWVAYLCQWTGSSWKCGCRDASCSQNYWQLQGVNR